MITTCPNGNSGSAAARRDEGGHGGFRGGPVRVRAAGSAKDVATSSRTAGAWNSYQEVRLRSYGQAYPVAHALDAVGDRWSLRVVRELRLGPRRHSDLSPAA